MCKKVAILIFFREICRVKRNILKCKKITILCQINIYWALMSVAPR